MKNLLSDDEFQKYLVDGYVILELDSLEESYHEFLYRKAEGIYRLAGAAKSKTSHLDIIGDNLRAQIPSIDRLIKDRQVVGALISILGGNYVLHPHNFVHRSGPADQGFHQDGNLPWNERGHYRSHRPDWALLFYYPQEVTLDNGPTEVLPGTQYWTVDCEKTDGDWHRGDSLGRFDERKLLGHEDLTVREQQLEKEIQSLEIPQIERRVLTLPRGSAVICNYDIFHRGSRCLSELPARYMFKFHFMRTQIPQKAMWDHQVNDRNLDEIHEDLRPVISHLWEWSKGSRKSNIIEANTIEKINEALLTGSENKRVAAAYQLGQIGSGAALDCLLSALDSEPESVRRAACHGLKASKNVDPSRLVSLTNSERAGTRRMSVYALGDSVYSNDKEVIDSLISRLKADPDDLVRSNSAYAIGQLARGETKFSAYMIDVLIERLTKGVESNNTEVALMPRSSIRQSISYALVQFAANHSFSGEQISNLVRAGLDDDDRYVQGLTIETLRLVEEIEKDTLTHIFSILSRTRLSPSPELL